MFAGDIIGPESDNGLWGELTTRESYRMAVDTN
jgi:hypothetical protein